MPHRSIDAHNRPPGAEGGAAARGLVPRDGNWVRFAGAMVILVVVAAALVLVLRTGERVTGDRLREMENLALTLSEQTDRALKSLELVQRSVIEDIAEQKVTTEAALGEVMGTMAVHRNLRDRIEGLPYVDAVTVINENGKLLNFTRYWPIPAVNVSDRDYFKALRAPGGSDLFISVPVPNRGTGTMTIYLARRFLTPEGRFLGLVLGAMEQSYFETFFSAIDLGRDGAIALFRDDGAYLAGYPNLGPVGSGPLNASAAALLSQPERQGEAAPGLLDGKSRLYAMRKLSAYPLSIVVTDSVAAVRDRWLRQIIPIVVFAGLICLAVIAAIIVVERHLLAQRRHAESERHAARHDSLTGLPNRLSLMEHLSGLPRARGEENQTALLLLDLDYFKSVNDTLGHLMGDRLLQAVAERLRDAAPAGAFVARLGGDEFAIVHPAHADSGMEMARTLIGAIRTPFQLDHHRVVAGGSIGVALTSEEVMSEGALLQQADLALYRAKAEGRGQARLFQKEMERAALMRRELELDLDAAWRERQFFLVYQPVCDARDNRVVGFEVLLRWRHPTRGIVLPGSFLPTAESMGLILPLGGWMLEEACIAAMAWPGDLFVSVDLSPIQLRAEGVARQVGAALSASGLPPRRLQLELPEQTLVTEGPAVLGILEGLRDEGVTVALDGFGMSYGTFSELPHLPVDRIKISPQLTRDLTGDSRALPLLRALNTLGNSLPLPPIVEGVNTAAARDALRAEGFALLQGEYCSAPLPLARACALARGESAAAY